MPQTIKKGIRDVLESMKPVEGASSSKRSAEDTAEMIAELTQKMTEAAERLDFEEAARLRDRIRKLEKDSKKRRK